MGRLVLLVLLLLVPLTAAACGGSDGQREVSPDSAVAEAATRTAEAGTSRVAYEAELSGGELPRPLTLAGEGEFDYDGQKGRLAYEMSGAFDSRFEVVVNGLVMYMKLPREALGGDLPRGKEWLKIDVGTLGEENGVDLGQLMQTRQDPAQFLRYVRGAAERVEEVGEEEVRGAQTTRYRMQVDVVKAVNQSLDDASPKMRRAARAAAEDLAEDVGKRTVPVEAWIDEEGLVRRVRMAFDVRAEGATRPRHAEMAMEFFDFGVDVTAKPPPDVRVLDLTNFAGHGEAKK